MSLPLPPPNRAGGSPAHGSPVGGLTSMRVGGTGRGRRNWRTARISQGSHVFFFDPHRRAANMGSHGHRVQRRVSPGCIVPRTHLPVGFPLLAPIPSTFLRPLAPCPLQALPRYYGRSDSCPALPAGQVSLIHVHGLPAIPSPTTWRAPAAAFARYPSARRVSRSPESRLRLSLAGSPDTPGRIEFVSLRTGRSPPVASHPASRRRGYIRLQAGERIPEADLHRSDHAHSQAH